MTTTLLAATKRTQRMVNREQELAALQQVIYRDDATCQVVLVTGSGGLGKSRLIEEVLSWGVTPPEGAADITPPLFADLIDMADFRLHTRSQFLHSLRDALSGAARADFPNYDTAYADFQRIRNVQGSINVSSEAEANAEKTFRQDYSTNSSQRRIVIAIDTAERLAISGFEWLQEKGLLTLEDLTFSTLRWLANQIKSVGLPNTTLILAGRDIEGAVIFNMLRTAADTSQVQITPLALRTFEVPEIQLYFSILAEDWQQRSQANRSDLRMLNIASTMERLAGDQETIKVLKLYTEGQPVRLALYTDLIVDGSTIPPQLNQSYKAALRSLGDNADGTALVSARRTIEREFINQLFDQSISDQTKRQNDILKTLVRAERELSIEQLHFVLDSPVHTSASEWQPDQNRLRVIEGDLTVLRELSIVKTIQKSPSERLITLQDEIYRIYAGVMLADENDRRDEREARTRLYQQLEDWASNKLSQLAQTREELQHEDESSLRIDSPAMALTARFQMLSDLAEQERIDIRERISALEVEQMYYALLSDPLRNFNDVYCSLADRRWLANDEEGSAIAQGEAWRILTRHETINFVDMSLPRHQTTAQALLALRRAALQENIVRWIKIFVMRQRYDRAIEFSRHVEGIIEKMGEDDRQSWQHTFASAERACWRGYAQIYKGKEIDAALNEVTPRIQELVALVNHRTDEPVFPERGENGFRGHPAESRIRRAIAVMYNVSGYGYATKGLFRLAAQNYSAALKYVRDTAFRALQATIRNNLSRALSELGRSERGRRICVDGLILRRREGAEVPIALSINTLALIDNDIHRSDLSWVEAATAIAYFRRAGDNRGLGLALIQLGESLRRLANQDRTGRVLADPPERIYDEAGRALNEALKIFQSGDAAGEAPRLVEVKIELGCLFRDRLRRKELARTPDQRRRNYQDAIHYLTSATDSARNLGLQRLEIDAAVNLAWAHYYEGEIERVTPMLERVEQLLPADCFMRPEHTPPNPDRDDSYTFFYLSKISNLKARLALDRFLQRVKVFREDYPTERAERQQAVHQDPQAQAALLEAADNFVQSLTYAQLFSPRSSALAVTYDHVYDYIKSFNAVELEDFRRFEQQARRRYYVDRLIIQDFSNLDQFMNECFGVSQTESTVDVSD
jgi:hypothetical protein